MGVPLMKVPSPAGMPSVYMAGRLGMFSGLGITLSLESGVKLPSQRRMWSGVLGVPSGTSMWW